jgi:hypothetical protein
MSPAQESSEPPGQSAGANAQRRGVDEAQDQARAQAEAEKARVGRTVEDVAGATRTAADDLERHGDARLADFARQTASQVSTLAESLHNRSADELLSEARRLAQTNPALFIGGSIGVGFALARLFRSGGDHEGQAHSADPARTGAASAATSAHSAGAAGPGQEEGGASHAH